MAKTDTTGLVPVGTVKGNELVVPATGATSLDLVYALANGLRIAVDEVEGTEEAFLIRTLTAEGGEADILGGSGLTKTEDLLNIPFRIVAYRGMRNSDFKESRLGVYAVVEVADKDDLIYTVALGSSDAVCKVVKLSEAGAIPQQGWSMLQKSEKQTKAGFYPVNLVAAPDPTSF